MGKSWLGALAVAAMLAASSSASAQTAAPAPAPAPAATTAESERPPLTAEVVANAFIEGMTLCAKASFRRQSIAQLPAPDRALVGQADAQLRAFAQVPEGRPAFDVLSASGVVLITEREQGSCEVLAYGPRVRPTFERAGAALVALNMSYVLVESGETPSDIFRAYERVSATGEKISVRFIGGEPGMEGREFKFPLLNAFFSRSGGARNFQ